MSDKAQTSIKEKPLYCRNCSNRVASPTLFRLCGRCMKAWCVEAAEAEGDDSCGAGLLAMNDPFTIFDKGADT